MSLLTTIKTLLGSAWHVNSDAFLAALLPATDGTVEANKVVTTDADKDIVAVRKIWLGVNGASGFAGSIAIQDGANPGASVTIDHADLAQIDTATRLVTITATGAITAALHAGRACLLGEVGGNALVTLTLPAATGSGNRYRFVVTVVNTSTYVIKVADATDTFNGQFHLLDNDAAAASSYAAIGGDDTLTLNGTTTGGQIGDWFEIEDIAADTWAVCGAGVVPAGSNPADPFSATVA